MMENGLDYFPPAIAPEVLPFRLWLGLPARKFFFAPYPLGPYPRTDLALRVTTARAHQVGEAVILHEITLEGGKGFPHVVAIRPDNALAPAVRAEPRDPELLPPFAPSAVDLFELPIFVSVVSGAGSLFLFVFPEFNANGQRIPLGELTARLLQLGDGDADGSLEIGVQKSHPQISFSDPPGQAPVGWKLEVPFSVALPAPDDHDLPTNWKRNPPLDSSGQFASSLPFYHSPRELALESPSRDFTNRWGRTRDTPIPYGLKVEGLDAEGQGDPPIRLRDPRTLRPDFLDWDRYGFTHGLEEYVLTRRPGVGTIRVATRDPVLGIPARALEHASADTEVRVQPVTLELALTSRDDVNGEILIQDRWREADEVLVAGFSLRVAVPPWAAQHDASPVVYDSDAQTAFLSTELSPDEIIVEIVVEDGEPNLFGPFGDNVRRSFRIRAAIDDTSVAQFWLPPDVVEGGRPNYVGDFRDMIRAVGPGAAELTIQLLEIPEPLPEECVEYGMPGVATMPIRVPPPLEAELTSWTDPYFTGNNLLTFDTDPSREVIYKSGVIRGLVRNHRDDSESELIRLAVARPDGQVLGYELDGGTLSIEPNGEVEQPVGDLAWTAADGENTVMLTAWKPINDVLGVGESHAEEPLYAVRPAKPRIAFAAPPGDGASPPRVIRRTLPDVAWTMALATRAELRDVAPSGSVLTLESDEHVAYGERQKSTPQPRLLPEAGSHRIDVLARNEFGATYSDQLEVVAVAPELDVALVIPPGYERNCRSPNLVGNIVPRVYADASTRYALNVEASGPHVQENLAPAQPFQQTTDRFILPEGPTELDVGADSLFVFTATNEFARTPREETVRRRGDVYDYELVRVWLRVRRSDRLIRGDVVLNGVSIQTIGPTDEDTLSFIDAIESPSVGFDLIQFEILREESDGDLVPAAAPIFVSIQTVGLVGPDYEDLVAVINVPDSRVVDDDGNIQVGPQRWLQVVLAEDEFGDIPVILISPP